MTDVPPPLATIGFGEAAKAFARGIGRDLSAGVRAYDTRTGRETARAGKLADYAEAGVKGCESLGEALDGAAIVLCLVPPDQT
ncbi:MAG: 3-hydroxyisobutyrate dehydrogenase, partial [Sphingomonadaceae bacterium]|nr:3-hydroxyisobutyrate dehydrogenase [Sphingomonadaceae bacterium]